MSASLLNLPPALALSAPFLIRGVAFALFGGYFCAGIIPLSALLSLVLALTIFSMPAHGGVTAILSSDGSGVSQLLPGDIAFQFVLGAAMGLIAGMFFWTGRIFARWTAAFILGERCHDTDRSTLETAILLATLVALSPLLPLFFERFAESYALFPARTASAALGPLLLKAAAAVGKIAFSSALLFLLPVGTIFAVLQIMFFLLKKIFPAAVSNGLIRSVSIPVMLLVAAQGVYRFSLYCSESEHALLSQNVFEQLKDIKESSGK